MSRPQPIPEQTQDVVTALRVQVDALAAELERLRDDNARLKAQVTSLLTTLTQDEFPDPAILHADCCERLALAKRALQDQAAVVTVAKRLSRGVCGHEPRYIMEIHDKEFRRALAACTARLDETTLREPSEKPFWEDPEFLRRDKDCQEPGCQGTGFLRNVPGPNELPCPRCRPIAAGIKSQKETAS